jgi:ABC-type dipeptide/oligopeptide/nickel transport system permease subunit
MRNTLRILLSSPKFMIGATLLAAVISFVFLYPLLNRNDPFEMVSSGFDSPSAAHPLGSDNFGRDVLLELAHGAKTSLFVGLTAGFFATVIGLIIGLLAGYAGGIVDNILTTINNMFIVIPPLVILILISIGLNSRSSATGILEEASISMLGLGPYNTISLGTMLNWAMMFEAMGTGAWWAFIPPAVLIGTFTFSLFMVNNGMDEVFNPKIRTSG